MSWEFKPEFKPLGPPPITTDQKLRREFKQVLKKADELVVEPSDEERKNGWTTESLSAYVAEQNAASEMKIDPNSVMNRLNRRPVRANSRYDPMRWRG